jgi:DtxR family Mn-dependent transcriptional regulator
MPTPSVENYLKAIYALQQEAGEERVKNGQIADALSLALPSVTSMLKALTAQGMLDYVPYQGVRLTEEGQRAALKVVRRHRLLEQFLIQTLGMSWTEVHEEAELLEHALSDKLTDRIDAFLGYPTSDPHGDPIPSSSGELPTQEGELLAVLAAAQDVQVVRVLSQHGPFLEYLGSKGLVPGAWLRLVEVTPFQGPLIVRVARTQELVSVSRETALLLKVRLASEPRV